MAKQFVKNIRATQFLSVQIIRKSYLETLFGMAWAVIQPLAFVATITLMFVFGFRMSGEIEGVPMVSYLLTAIIPWQLISQTITNGPIIYWKNLELIKTINFPVETIALSEFFAKLLVHLFVMVVVILINWQQGFPPTIYYLNFIYLYIVLSLFLLYSTMILACISLFVHDTHLTISSLMMPIFWITPIMWEPVGNIRLYEMIFNPFYYFIELFRDTLLYKEWWWTNIYYDIYIWTIILILYLVSTGLYRRVRSQMADIV
ncbi:MAG: ABC transporter permease [Mycoplasmatales bacterium]